MSTLFEEGIVTLHEGGEVDPDTRGQENTKSMSTKVSIGITFAVWAIMPRGGQSFTKTPPRDVLSIW